VSPAQSALNSRPSDKSAADPQSSTDKPTPENGRVFGLMPNYGTVDSTHVAPMSAADKFKLALRYIDPYTFGVVAFRAGIEQATNSKEEYGQGMEGYGKRYGADFADGLTNSFFVTGVFPSLLHQDPRYFRRGQGAFLSRASYAASRVLITRQDSGRKSFNFSEVLGNAASAGISQAYYPESERTMGDFAVRTGVQFGFDAGFNVVKEFYPDVVRKLFKKKSQPQSPGQSAN
jgi:hypothetical protein